MVIGIHLLLFHYFPSVEVVIVHYLYAVMHVNHSSVDRADLEVVLPYLAEGTSNWSYRSLTSRM